jgi:hypothetical protein
VQRRNRKPERPEAEAPQSVRPPGAENYPEPCPRNRGTERRCVREIWNQAAWRVLKDARLVRRRPTVPARAIAG